MEDLSLHILDIAQNAIRAGAKKIMLKILEDEVEDRLILCIEDDGKGMDKEMRQKAQDPFFTTKDDKKFGLGLALLSQAAEETTGSLKIDSRQPKGTKVTAVFKPGHPDMKPMGDIPGTMSTLIAANSAIQFIFDYKKGDFNYHFDSFEQQRK
jgi:signal transduction histidine kinase